MSEGQQNSVVPQNEAFFQSQVVVPESKVETNPEESHGELYGYTLAFIAWVGIVCIYDHLKYRRNREKPFFLPRLEVLDKYDDDYLLTPKGWAVKFEKTVGHYRDGTPKIQSEIKYFPTRLKEAEIAAIRKDVVAQYYRSVVWHNCAVDEPIEQAVQNALADVVSNFNTIADPVNLVKIRAVTDLTKGIRASTSVEMLREKLVEMRAFVTDQDKDLQAYAFIDHTRSNPHQSRFARWSGNAVVASLLAGWWLFFADQKDKEDNLSQLFPVVLLTMSSLLIYSMNNERKINQQIQTARFTGKEKRVVYRAVDTESFTVKDDLFQIDETKTLGLRKDIVNALRGIAIEESQLGRSAFHYVVHKVLPVSPEVCASLNANSSPEDCVRNFGLVQTILTCICLQEYNYMCHLPGTTLDVAAALLRRSNELSEYLTEMQTKQKERPIDRVLSGEVNQDVSTREGKLFDLAKDECELLSVWKPIAHNCAVICEKKQHRLSQDISKKSMDAVVHGARLS